MLIFELVQVLTTWQVMCRMGKVFLYSVMHNDDMPLFHNSLHLLSILHLVQMYLDSHLDHKNDHYSMCNLDRNRRT